MKMDYDLALQVFERLSKSERAAIFSSINFLMAVDGTVRSGNFKEKIVCGLLAVNGRNLQVDASMVADVVAVRFEVDRGSLYGLSIEDGKQRTLPMKSAEMELEEPVRRKPRLIL